MADDPIFVRTASLNKYAKWFFFTFLTSIIPLVIKAVLLAGTGFKFSLSSFFQNFRVELFFLTIIFLVDAIKNYKSGTTQGIFTSFLLIIGSILYGLAMTDSLNLLNASLASQFDFAIIIIVIISFLWDIGSVYFVNER